MLSLIRLLQPLQQFLLLRSGMLGYVDTDRDELVAPPSVLFNPHFRDSQHGSVPCPCGDFQHHFFPLHRIDPHRTAENSLFQGKGHVAMDDVSLPPEKPVRLHAHGEYQVSRCPALGTGLTLALEPYLSAVRDARGTADGIRDGAVDLSLSSAADAGFADDSPGSHARRTRPAHAECALADKNRTPASAFRTGGRLGSRFRSGAATFGTVPVLDHRDGCFPACGGQFEGDPDFGVRFPCPTSAGKRRLFFIAEIDLLSL